MVSSLMFFNGQFIFTTILQVLSVLFSLFFVSLIPLPYLYIITEQSCLFSLFFLQIIPKIKPSSLLMSRSVCSPCFSLFCRHQIYPQKNFIVNESAALILLVFECLLLQLWSVLMFPLVLFTAFLSPAQFCTTRYSKSTVVGAVTFLLSTLLVLKRSRAQFCSKCDSKSTAVEAVTLLLKPFCYNTFSGTILQ